VQNPRWLTWAKKLQAIAQIGLTYATDPFDRERYEQIRELSLEMMHEHTGEEPGRLRELFAGETGYQTPKLDVRVAVVRDGEILLVRQTGEEAWALPGGWVDVDTSVMEAAVKEAHEEAGLEVRPVKLIALLDRAKQDLDPFPYSITTAFVGCEPIGGSFRENAETEEARFFPVSGLPTLSTIRTSRAQIEMCYRSITEGWTRTIFD
jgi:ADP-ribose pyrophosphatase YjhB (NUDIX family)